MPFACRRRSPDFHHDVAADLTDENIRKYLLISPRDHAKTTLCAAAKSLHHIFMRPFTLRDSRKAASWFVVIGARGQKDATNTIETIKMALEESVVLRELFGDFSRETSIRWGYDEIVTRRRDVILCRGAVQGARGLNKYAQRPTYIHWDDAETEKNTRTADAMKDNLDVLIKGIVPALCAEYGDKVVLTGTPIRGGCMVEKVWRMAHGREKASEYEVEYQNHLVGWHAKRYAAILRGPDHRMETGTALWEERHPLKKLLAEYHEMKRVGQASAFYSEWMCELRTDEDQQFDRYAYWDGRIEVVHGKHFLILTGVSPNTSKDDNRVLRELSKPAIIPVNVFGGVDPASSLSERADRTVVGCVAIDRRDRRYVLPYEAGRMPVDQQRETILAMDKRLRPLMWRIETIAYQNTLKQDLAGKIRVVGETHPENLRKSQRHEGMQPLFADGKMYLPHKKAALLEQEMETFGRASDHDDTLDMLYLSMKKIYPPYHTVSEYYDRTEEDHEPDAVDWMLC